MNRFDEFADSYDVACAEGLKLSGESRDYFAQQRISHTRRFAADRTRAGISTVVDFGCGLGHSTPHLRDAFPDARIVGIDTSNASVDAARRRYSNAGVQFIGGGDELPAGSVDIVYSNGTFHHIPPADRQEQVERLFRWLSPGGLFALWENNPWNPGTRLVMRRIPFDRDAQPLSGPETAKLLTAGGYRVGRVSFHFYFPGWLRALRRFERYLEHVPLGAQYCVIARKPSSYLAPGTAHAV